MKYPKLYPGVYRLYLNPHTGKFDISYMYDKFELPERVYGKLPYQASLIWDSIEKDGYRGGALLTGIKGAGKTELAKLIANKAIDAGIPVIMITDIPNPKDIQSYLTQFDNALLFFDEMGKNIPRHDQDKLLNLMSDKNKRLIYLITENNENMLSDFILGRPGRIKFHISFKKLPRDTLVDYIEDNKDLEYDFILNLLDLYNRASRISFDHVKVLVDEHKKHPNIPFTELVDILNLGDLKKPVRFIVESVVDDKGTKWTVIDAAPKNPTDDAISTWCIELMLRKLPEDKKATEIDDQSERPTPNPFGSHMDPNEQFNTLTLTICPDDIIEYEPGKSATYKKKIPQINRTFTIRYKALVPR